MINAVSDFVSPQGRILGTVLEVGAKRLGIYVSVRWTANVRKKNEDPSAANRAMLEQRKPKSRQRRSKRRLENFLAWKKAAVGVPAVQAERQSGGSTVELEDRFSQNCQSTETLDLRMMHSSITDHIDRDGAECCNSNLPHPMLMKLSGQTNNLLSCVVL